MNFILVAIGGFVGSILRFYISIKLNKRLIGTWIANISGSVLMAFSIFFYSIHVLNESHWLFLGVGLCGSYTTFSTFGNEALQLILNNNMKAAIRYIISTLFISILVIISILVLLGYKF
ncbi:fluoride efflux transporter FluC [Paucisalibacillus globulus]|uniref:fluoride efflux transporter FluC n=1 Tax=Paucisalibacillus globulus TaxID=351095 RepID=UPI000479BC7C|nr:CrcB family protein [Paucisalibacillus globulus]